MDESYGPARALRAVWTRRRAAPRPHSRASRPQAPQDPQPLRENRTTLVLQNRTGLLVANRPIPRKLRENSPFHSGSPSIQSNRPRERTPGPCAARRDRDRKGTAGPGLCTRRSPSARVGTVLGTRASRPHGEEPSRPAGISISLSPWWRQRGHRSDAPRLGVSRPHREEPQPSWKSVEHRWSDAPDPRPARPLAGARRPAGSMIATEG